MKRQPRRGITLIEMLAVLVIIALVATVALMNVSGSVVKARRDTARAVLVELGQAVDTFKLSHGKLPASLQDLVTAPGWVRSGYPVGGYLKTKIVPNDPWGNPYLYSVESNGEYRLLSDGQDGQAGGTGDDADLVLGEP